MMPPMDTGMMGMGGMDMGGMDMNGMGGMGMMGGADGMEKGGAPQGQWFG
jgi:hypothetical protein